MSNRHLPHVKRYREKMGVTQAELSELSGVSLRTIQRVEMGSKASLETARALASAFSLTSHQVLINDSIPADELDNETHQHINNDYDPEKLIKLAGWGNRFAITILSLTLAIAFFAIAYEARKTGGYFSLLAIPIILIAPFGWKAIERWLQKSEPVGVD